MYVGGGQGGKEGKGQGVKGQGTRGISGTGASVPPKFFLPKNSFLVATDLKSGK